MKIVILGAGGIGSLAGALLSRDNDVLLIGRKKHVDEINKNGLRITGALNENFKLKAETKLKNIEDKTLIILATKVTDSKKSIIDIKGLIKKDTIILCMQNGIGSEDIVKDIVECKVLRCITTAGTTFLEPGKVSCSNIGNICLEKDKVSEEINELLNRSRFKAEISDDIKINIWKKSIANCIMNTLTAILEVENSKMLSAKELIKDLLRELVLVAKKEKLNFNEHEIYDNLIDIIKNSSSNKSSMLQDILMKRQTEIDFLNGKIVEMAEKHNLEVPINRTLVEIIKFKENNY